MAPLIPDGSTALVNRGATSVIDGQVYALRQHDEVSVKRLRKHIGGFIATSGNTFGNPDLHLTLEDPTIEIIGRVFWVGIRL